MKLTDKQRAKIVEGCADSRRSCMFGDGMEDEYIYDGVQIVGLRQMSDEELYEEYVEGVEDDDELVVEIEGGR